MKPQNLVVIIPSYNEKSSIISVIAEIPKKIQGIKSVKTVVIDDGSTDGTREILEKRKDIYYLRHNRNIGLGRSFDDGLKKAISLQADIIVCLDADGQFDSKEITKLILPITKEQADVVIGSRFIKKNRYKTTTLKRIGNKLLAKIISILIKKRLYDVTCGFRAYSREVALNLNIYDKFSYTLESIMEITQRGFAIKEIPVKVRPRKWGKSKITRSIIYYLVKSCAIIIRYLRDQRSFHFFVLPGIISFTLALIGLTFLTIRFIRLHILSPYRSLLAVSLAFLFLAVFLFGIGLVFDYMSKIKKNEDDILYYLKKNDKEK